MLINEGVIGKGNGSLLTWHHQTQKKRLKESVVCQNLISGGERGIRTPGASQLNGFQDRRNRPLCHLSRDKSTAVFYIIQIF